MQIVYKIMINVQITEYITRMTITIMINKIKTYNIIQL